MIYIDTQTLFASSYNRLSAVNGLGAYIDGCDQSCIILVLCIMGTAASSTCMPRSCLKLNHRPESDTDDDDPLPFPQDAVLPPAHVHFPPTPTLTSTHATHSSSVYDRAPINISPNRCELPERGGRVYTPSPVGSFIFI